MNNMISLSFSVWELAVLIVAIAFVFGTVYLIKVLKNLAETLGNTNKLMEENREAINNIVNDAEEMTSRANTMTMEVQGTIDNMKNEIIDPLVQALSKIVKVAGVLKKREKKIKKV